MTREEDVAALKSVKLLAGLSDSELHEVSRMLEVREYPGFLTASRRSGPESLKKAVIVRQGTEGDHRFFILRCGCVAVTKEETAGSGLPVRFILPRDEYNYFGELSVLDNEPRSATVTALVPTTCWVMKDSTDFSKILDHLSVAQHVMYGLAEQLRRTTNTFETHVKLLAPQKIVIVLRYLAGAGLGPSDPGTGRGPEENARVTIPPNRELGWLTGLADKTASRALNHVVFRTGAVMRAAGRAGILAAHAGKILEGWRREPELDLEWRVFDAADGQRERTAAEIAGLLGVSRKEVERAIAALVGKSCIEGTLGDDGERWRRPRKGRRKGGLEECRKLQCLFHVRVLLFLSTLPVEGDTGASGWAAVDRVVRAVAARPLDAPKLTEEEGLAQEERYRERVNGAFRALETKGFVRLDREPQSNRLVRAVITKAGLEHLAGLPRFPGDADVDDSE